MPKQFFTTADLALTAFLRLQDYSIVGVQTEGGKGFFRFEDKPERESLVLRFFNKQTTCEPLGFLEQIRNLKSLIRQSGTPANHRVLSTTR